MADAELKLKVAVEGTASLEELIARTKDQTISLKEMTGLKKQLNEFFKTAEYGSEQFKNAGNAIASLNDRQRDARILTKAGHEEYFKLGLQLREAAIGSGQLSGGLGQLTSSLSSGTSAALGISSALKPLGIQMSGMSTGMLSLAMALPSMLDTISGYFRTTGIEIANTNREMEHTLRLQNELGTKSDKELLDFLERTAKTNRQKIAAGAGMFTSKGQWEKEKAELLKQAEDFETDAARIRKRLKDKDQKDAEDTADKAVRQEERRQTAVASVIKNEFDRRAALTKLQFEKEIKDAGDNNALKIALEKQLTSELDKIESERRKKAKERERKIEQSYREDSDVTMSEAFDRPGADARAAGKALAERMRRQNQQRRDKKDKDKGQEFDPFKDSFNAGIEDMSATVSGKLGGAFAQVFGGAESLLGSFAASFAATMTDLAAKYAIGTLLGLIGGPFAGIGGSLLKGIGLGSSGASAASRVSGGLQSASVGKMPTVRIDNSAGSFRVRGRDLVYVTDSSRRAMAGVSY